MIEEKGTSELEIFLIRTLTPKERKFSPGKVRLVMCPIASFDWVPGDILVRRSTLMRNGFECKTVPKYEHSANCSTVSDPPFRYNRVTIQRDCANLDDAAADEGESSLVGTRFIYQADFAAGKSLELVIQKDFRQLGFDLSKYLARTLIPGTKGCIINNNRAEVLSASGVHAFVISLNRRLLQVKSFCLRDIVWGLGKISQLRSDLPGFSFARPLTYFWANEAFDFHLVADAVLEAQGSQCAEGEATIDGALRYLVGHMLETRQAISDLIVDLMFEVAAEISAAHSSLDRMRRFGIQIKELREIQRLPRLRPCLLQQLVAYDLKRVLPVFESDFENLFSSLDPVFKSRVQQKFESMVSMIGVFYKGDFSVQCSNLAAQHLLLKMQHPSKQNTEGALCDPDGGNSLSYQQLGSTQRFLRLTQANTTPQMDGYEAVLFHGLRSDSSIDVSSSSAVAKIKAIISKSQGYILKKHQLVCWQQIKTPLEVDPEVSAISTSFTFIDLERVEKLCVVRSDEVPEGEWLRQHELKLELMDWACTYLEGSTLYFLDVEEDDWELYLHSLQLIPKMEHQIVKLSKEIIAHLSFWGTLPTLGKFFEFCVLHSTKLGLIFLSHVSEKRSEPRNYYSFSYEITLSASATQRLDSESLVAVTIFKETQLPNEISIPWTFNRTDSVGHGMNPHTLGMPYAPLRWCTSRQNVYCVWLLSPHSHIIFGFQQNCFVKLVCKLSYRSLSLDPPYVLPAFTMDRVCGMVGLFMAKRTWSTQKNRWILTVYKLRLEQY